MDIMSEIRKNYADFTSTQRKIADFIVSNPEIACFQSLKEFSQDTDVTEVTVINFAKKIGIDSFVQLKKEIQYFIQSEMSPNLRIESVLSQMKKDDEELGNVINNEVDNVEMTISKLELDDIKNAVKLLTEAKKIYIIGVGISSIVREFLIMRFSLLGLDVDKFEISTYNIMSMKTLKLDQSDVFLVISFPKYSRIASVFIDYLGEKNYKMISITNSKKSPLAKYSTVVFECGNNSMVFYNSMLGSMVISEILVQALSLEMKEKVIEQMKDIKKLEEFFKDENLYDK